jgi:DNA polymerase-3 subunit gamma/tau
MSQAASHDADSDGAPAGAGPSAGRDYVVVARRYRPQTFDELIGQQHVSHALTQAIAANRVGHAYLFTGARGVGKTSAARIFAKALNCVNGPSSTPCNRCDSCAGIAVGEDVDVLEIDGASNRGIEEVRQMRANVNIRPSRSRLKIYIIDEVHMLTLPAFNALLKTLEEPPEHVKFIFCTTDPEKVPITVLSRCQRFDFAGIQAEAICERLRQIAGAEGANVDDAALKLLARRAAGSMRDSQSLLEQLLAFGGQRITEDDVHSMLGTARGGQLTELGSCLTRRDAAGALAQLDEALNAGVDPGQLIDQLLGYFRDMMTAVVGCQPEMLLYCTSDDYEELRAAGEQMGLNTILAVQQILDHTLTRARQSVHVRTLAELAVVRICSLENLDDLARVISALKRNGGPLPVADQGRHNAAKEPRSRQSPPNSSIDAAPALRPPPSISNQTGADAAAAPAATTLASPPQPNDHGSSQPIKTPSVGAPAAPEGAQAAPDTTSSEPEPLSQENARRMWDETLAAMGDMTAENASRYTGVAISAPNTLEITFSAKYTSSKTFCERPERARQLEQAMTEAVGSPVQLVFKVQTPDSTSPTRPKPRQSQRELMREKAANPMVRKAMELFDGHVTRVDVPRDPQEDGG